MTCDERKDLILLYAADALDEAEQQDLRSHLRSGCARCAQVLAESEDTLARLPEALPPVEPPPDALNRLMRRVVADQARGTGAVAGLSWLTAAKAACIGMLIGGVIIYALQGYRHDRALDLALAQVSQKDQQLGELNSMLASEKLKFVGLAQEQSPAFGRILWDQQKQNWHVYVFDLKPPPPGRTYELWFIKPDQTKVPAGTFDTDASGKGTMMVKVPENIGPIALAAITDEPMGGSLQPTGSIHLVGQIQ
jgi:anti-sigma-K factor RskA